MKTANTKYDIEDIPLHDKIRTLVYSVIIAIIMVSVGFNSMENTENRNYTPVIIMSAMMIILIILMIYDKKD
jgi:hypothetical protein